MEQQKRGFAIVFDNATERVDFGQMTEAIQDLSFYVGCEARVAEIKSGLRIVFMGIREQLAGWEKVLGGVVKKNSAGCDFKIFESNYESKM
jgi:hypothetical protein